MTFGQQSITREFLGLWGILWFQFVGLARDFCANIHVIKVHGFPSSARELLVNIPRGGGKGYKKGMFGYFLNKKR